MFKDAIPGTPQPRRVTRPMDFIVWFLVLLFVCAMASRGNAHNAPSGAAYLPECCNSQDCAVVKDIAVEELGGGHVRMTFAPGSHPMWGKDRTHVLIIDYGPQHRKEPLDGEWHGCFSPSLAPLCYHPPMRGF
jgi:hypothetical protein